MEHIHDFENNQCVKCGKPRYQVGQFDGLVSDRPDYRSPDPSTKLRSLDQTIEEGKIQSQADRIVAFITDHGPQSRNQIVAWFEHPDNGGRIRLSSVTRAVHDLIVSGTLAAAGEVHDQETNRTVETVDLYRCVYPPEQPGGQMTMFRTHPNQWEVD